jgi:hypothetical protein
VASYAEYQSRKKHASTSKLRNQETLKPAVSRGGSVTFTSFRRYLASFHNQKIRLQSLHKQEENLTSQSALQALISASRREMKASNFSCEFTTLHCIKMSSRNAVT